MITIIKAVIAKMVADGHDIDCVYGERWVHGFKSDKIEKITFFVTPQEYSYDTNTGEKLVNLKWMVAKEVDQSEIDEDINISLESTIETMNLHFIQELKRYVDVNDRQLINDFQTVKCTAFHDITLLSHSGVGFLCEVQFKQILLSSC